MIILFSPTKQMDFESSLSPLLSEEARWTEPLFADRADRINSRLESLDTEGLRALMSVSPKLAEQTKKMIASFPSARKRPALAAYSGTAFKYLDTPSLDAGALRFARDHLRILSGMYGLLRPLDRIAPYRLEMKTPLVMEEGRGGTASMTAYWRPVVSRELAEEAPILNLASAEYSRVVSFKDKMVDIQFKEERGGDAENRGDVCQAGPGADAERYPGASG